MTDKLKVLCLHGYRQNASKFRGQIGSLRKMLKNEVDFHFLSAPNQLSYYEKQGDEEDQRAWWFSTSTGFSSRDVTNTDTGLNESLRIIEKFVKENGPFQGILGFSQGAALAGILCALKDRKEIDIEFNFVIIVSGFKSKCLLHVKYYEQKIEMNSLHVIGEGDQIISKDMSYDLASVFVNPVILSHAGGHFVPGRSSLKEKYLGFILSQMTT